MNVSLHILCVSLCLFRFSIQNSECKIFAGKILWFSFLVWFSWLVVGCGLWMFLHFLVRVFSSHPPSLVVFPFEHSFIPSYFSSQNIRIWFSRTATNYKETLLILTLLFPLHFLLRFVSASLYFLSLPLGSF